MLFLHFIAAVMASWRITELFTQDRVTVKLREKFKTYLWQCPRCMSVWASAWVTLVFVAGLKWPAAMWLNWPFALAWVYIVQLDWAVARRISNRGRQMVIEVAQNGQYQFRSDLSSSETMQMLGTIIQQLHQPQPQQQVNGETKGG